MLACCAAAAVTWKTADDDDQGLRFAAGLALLRRGWLVAAAMPAALQDATYNVFNLPRSARRLHTLVTKQLPSRVVYTTAALQGVLASFQPAYSKEPGAG